MTSIDWANDSAATIRTQLLMPVWVPTNAAVTISMIRDTIGLTAEQYAMVRDTLDEAITTLKASGNQTERAKGLDLQDALAAMVSKGASLSELDRQATVDLLAAFGEWPDAVRDAVKALGGAYVGRWSQEGFATEPTLEQVTARKSLEATKVQWSAVKGVVDDRLHTGAVTTWAEVVAIVEAV